MCGKLFVMVLAMIKRSKISQYEVPRLWKGYYVSKFPHVWYDADVESMYV